MEIKELKTKIKIVFPSESEIFMAEEFLEALHGCDISKKEIEADLSDVSTIDTVFLQILISLAKTAADNGQKINIKSNEAIDSALAAYGMKPDELTGGIG
ncbi:MAG: STAS domain-containing protein [Deferribacterales bacterium]